MNQSNGEDCGGHEPPAWLKSLQISSASYSAHLYDPWIPSQNNPLQRLISHVIEKNLQRVSLPHLMNSKRRVHPSDPVAGPWLGSAFSVRDE